MVRQWQELFEGKRYSGTPLSGPDFARLAEAYGLPGYTVEEVGEVDDIVRRAWDTDDSVVIDFRVEREVNVFPIVPQGKGIHEMLTEQEHEEASVG
jgi:acetolactate synthase-1/2/3 large subunit